MTREKFDRIGPRSALTVIMTTVAPDVAPTFGTAPELLKFGFHTFRSPLNSF